MNTTFFTFYVNDSYKNADENPLSRLDENVIIFIDQNQYDYIKEIRKNFINKTYLLIVSNANFMLDKHKFINKMISINPFKSNKFAWCDISYIDTYLSQGLPDTIVDLSSLNSDDIKGGFLFQ